MVVDIKKRAELQNWFVTETLRHYEDGHLAVLGVAPTGTGKTVMGIDTVKSLSQDKNKPTTSIFVQDRLALTEQNHERAKEFGLTSTALWTEGKTDQSGHHLFATIDTSLKDPKSIPRRDIAILDEAHHSRTATDNSKTDEYTRLLDSLYEKNDKMRLLALTATDKRTDNADLHPRIANAPRVTISYHQAIETGAIVTPVTHIPNQQAPSKNSKPTTLSKAIDDYLKHPDDPGQDQTLQAGIQSLVRKTRGKDFPQKAVEAWSEIAHDTPTFVYVPKISDTDKFVAAFRAAGHSAEAIHSDRTAAENRASVKNFENGKTNILVSVGMLTEGIDQTRVSTILNAKELMTLNEMKQSAGRAMRAHTEYDATGKMTSDKQSATIIDLGATTAVHGSLESHIALQTLAMHGHAKGTTPLWQTVDQDKGIKALRRPYDTIYAVPNPHQTGPGDAYKLVQAIPSAKQNQGYKFRRFHQENASRQNLDVLERQAADNTPKFYASLMSRTPDGNSLQSGKKLQTDSFANTLLQTSTKALYDLHKSAVQTISQDMLKQPTKSASPQRSASGISR